MLVDGAVDSVEHQRYARVQALMNITSNFVEYLLYPFPECAKCRIGKMDLTVKSLPMPRNMNWKSSLFIYYSNVLCDLIQAEVQFVCLTFADKFLFWDLKSNSNLFLIIIILSPSYIHRFWKRHEF